MSNPNILDLPDDELEAYLRDNPEALDSDPVLEEDTEEQESEEGSDEENDSSDDSDDSSDEDDEEQDDDDEEDDEEDSDSEDDDSEDGDEDDSSEGESDADEESNEDVSEETNTTDDTKSEETNVDTKTEIDYKSQYEEILKPFKANGKEISVDNVEDVRQLMQMGANYNKKMAALKPNLKLVKMLDNNDLLDESKINMFIDAIGKKNPEAIKQLIKDSGIDPLDVDTDKVDYTPGQYAVSDNEVELDGILEEIRETDSYNETLDIVGNRWDERSRQMVAQSPDLIRVINEHVQSGVFKTVSDTVERERVLGRLNGLSDIEAYKQVGDSINAKGGFEAQAQESRPNLQSTSEPTNVNKTNRKAPSSKATSKKKKAAGSTRSKPRQAEPQFNPLDMSDEEFEKMSASKFV